MKKLMGLCVAASVVLGLGARASAQNIQILPPEAPPPRRSPATPAWGAPEVSPGTPAEAAPATPPEAPPAPPEAPAPAPSETPAAATPAAATPAAAAAFGEAWHYAISLERAVGFDHVSQTQSSIYIADTKTTATNLSLFGAPSSGALAVFSFPRAAFDLFVATDFSVGIALGALYGSTTVTPSGGSSTDQSFTGLLAAPRAGYALNLAPDITLWARGGVSVAYVKINPGNTYPAGSISSHFVAATIELPVVFTVLPRLALTAGPTFDITFDGHLSRPSFGYGGSESIDQHVTEIGIQGGVLLYL